MTTPFPSAPDTPPPDALLARARDLVPLLRVNAAETERRGRLTEDTVTALRDAGFLTLSAPRQCGGLEADIRTWVGVIAELADPLP